MIVTVVLALKELIPAVQERASAWAALELRHRVRPVHPNHGKPGTGVAFESAVWLVDITVWSTGEADLYGAPD
jgi:hypothetical protein